MTDELAEGAPNAHYPFADWTESATQLVPLTTQDFPDWLSSQTKGVSDWVRANDFVGQAGVTLRLPLSYNTILVGLGASVKRWSFAGLPATLPTACYRFDADTSESLANSAALDWALGSYTFDRYKASPRSRPMLCWPPSAGREAIGRAARAIGMGRDLINTPANEMGPQELENAARQIVRRYGGALKAIVGDELLTQGFLIVHAVGRASCSPPRVIDFTWGNPHHPKITIVGKGVCFDSGGLNLKSHSSMLLMKKDMAGAAHALALADMIMSAKLPVRLRVMVPAVENSVSGNAMRPLDIVRARNGLSVEITNTDSEGRLILSDVLVEASSEKPEMIVDFASLTSAAGVALGPDLPAMFCNDDAIASMLQASATRTDDPLWRLPLWKEYSGDISSDNADLVNKPAVAWTFAASIYAALFLERFVDPSVKWVHIDTLGWNIKSRPGRPEGGEIRNVLALFNFFQTRFPIGRQ